MKIHIRDMLLLFVIVSIGLAWWKDRSGHHAEIRRIRVDLEAAESSLESRNKALQVASQEADILAVEVRRLRGVVKTSLGDQRQWFELEVEGKKLIAIRAGASQANVLTLENLERIESETGMEAPRLRHFLTPISKLRLEPY